MKKEDIDKIANREQYVRNKFFRSVHSDSLIGIDKLWVCRVSNDKKLILASKIEITNPRELKSESYYDQAGRYIYVPFFIKVKKDLYTVNLLKESYH